MEEPYECDVSLQVNVWYASRRPDLACIDSYDLLQGMHKRPTSQSINGFVGIGYGNPRCEIVVKPLPEFQSSLGGHRFRSSDLGSSDDGADRVKVLDWIESEEFRLMGVSGWMIISYRCLQGH